MISHVRTTYIISSNKDNWASSLPERQLLGSEFHLASSMKVKDLLNHSFQDENLRSMPLYRKITVI